MNTIKLFLIDDDEDDRELFEYALKAVSQHIDFSFAGCGHSALAALKLHSSLPDYIFLDLHMPGMDGIECLEAIKALPFLKHIPVIIYSSRGNREYEQHAKNLQAAHYLIKPFRSAELTGVLDELLSGSKLPFLLPAKVCV